MASKKRTSLGTGLEILLSRPLAQVRAEDISGATHLVDEKRWVEQLPLDAIVSSPYQPRQYFDEQELQELADSMKQQGIIQPIVVRKKEGKFELIAGERRWRAARLAGLSEIPVLVQEVGDQQALLMALVENMARSDLNPLEEARGLYRLLNEFGLTHQETADFLGRSRSQVTNTLRLLGLSERVKALLESQQLEMGHARALLSLRHEWQDGLAERIVVETWTVRKTEQEVAKLQFKKPFDRTSDKPIFEPDPNVEHLKRRLSDHLGLAVDIQTRAKGKGKLVIHYDDWSQMGELLGRFHLLEEEEG